MRGPFRHLTYANVISTLALFAALGGSAYAAAKITGKQVKDGTLTTKDVRNRSLMAIDFRAGQLPAGPQGPTGPAGPAGAAGKDGAPGRDGAPGTARAYALVDPVDAYGLPAGTTYPAFVPAHTKNFAALRRQDTGVYCLTAAVGIDPATAAAVASPDWSASSGESILAFVDHNNSACDDDEFEVHTYDTGNPATPANDVGFSIIVG